MHLGAAARSLAVLSQNEAIKKSGGDGGLLGGKERHFYNEPESKAVRAGVTSGFDLSNLNGEAHIVGRSSIGSSSRRREGSQQTVES